MGLKTLEIRWVERGIYLNRDIAEAWMEDGSWNRREKAMMEMTIGFSVIYEYLPYSSNKVR